MKGDTEEKLIADENESVPLYAQTLMKYAVPFTSPAIVQVVAVAGATEHVFIGVAEPLVAMAQTT